MSWVFVKQAEAAPAGSPLQTQLMLGGGGGGSGMFLTPEKPITPQEAGMNAAMQHMRGRSYSPEQTQAIASRASRAAQMAGRYGGLAAMLGAGVKNLYDQTATGEPLGLTSLGTSMYGAQQFARPIATRAGAQMGARVGVRRAGTPQGEMANYQQGAMAQPFNIPQGTDMSMFNAPTPAPPTQTPPVTMDNSRQAGLGEFSPGMSGGLQSSPTFTSATDDAMQQSMEQMKEQQKQAQENKKEMEQSQLQSLQENLKEKRDEQSTGA